MRCFFLEFYYDKLKSLVLKDLTNSTTEKYTYKRLTGIHDFAFWIIAVAFVRNQVVACQKKTGNS